LVRYIFLLLIIHTNILLVWIINELTRKSYKIRYFKHNETNDTWKPGYRKLWKGTCTREMILVTKVSLTDQLKLSQQTKQYIDFVLVHN
jgi:hypothetical protein